MAHKKITVLAVCASGLSVGLTLTRKIEHTLASLGVDVTVIHLVPTVVEGFLAETPVDFIVTTSPIPGEITVPVINGISLLSGFGEAGVVEEIQHTAQSALEAG